MARRVDDIRGLVEGALEAGPVEGGYQLVLPGTEGQVRRLLELIEAERRCCPQLAFELELEPHDGPIRLRVLGIGPTDAP